jgi:rhodanese-related sulfurtransferase
MNKKILEIAVVLMSVAMLASSLIGIVLASPYTNISVQEARKMILGNKYPDLLVIDLRPPPLFNAWHIRGAINVPMAGLATWIAADAGSHFDDEIIVHCLMGFQSPSAADMLDLAGYNKVYNMEGGFNAWIEAGYQTTQTNGPLKALIVGKNPKVDGVVLVAAPMLDDVGPNNIFWFNMEGKIIQGNDASKGGGKMNNAIMADFSIVLDMVANPEEYENKWIYLSGENEPQQDDHGMFYWVFVQYFGPDATAILEQEYSDGIFCKINSVGN